MCCRWGVGKKMIEMYTPVIIFILSKVTETEESFFFKLGSVKTGVYISFVQIYELLVGWGK